MFLYAVHPLLRQGRAAPARDLPPRQRLRLDRPRAGLARLQQHREASGGPDLRPGQLQRQVHVERRALGIGEI